MFHSMRYLGSSLFAKIMVVFIAIAFAMWGVGDVITGQSVSYAARVGSSRVSIADFQYQRTLINRQIQALGIKEMDASKLDIAVIRQLVQQQLLIESIHDAGLFVNDSLLAQRLRTHPQFTTKDGKFDATAFRNVLANARINEAMFSGQLRREISSQFMTDSLDLADAGVPSSVLALESSAAAETRDAVVVTLSASAPADVMTNSALQEFYEANKLRYLTPPTRTLEYVRFAPGEIDRWIDQQVTPEMRDFATQSNPSADPNKLAVLLREQAREPALTTLKNSAEDALAGGATLGGAMEKLGVKAQSRLLENVTAEEAKNRWDVAEKSAIEQGGALSDGEVSGVIRSSDGAFLMVAVKSTNPAAPKPIEAVMGDVRTGLRLQLARDAARTKAREIISELSREKDWRAVLAKSGAWGREVRNITRPAAGRSNGFEIPEALHQAIFERKPGEVAGPLALPNGTQMIALITDVHFPEPKPDAKEKATLTNALIEQTNQEIIGTTLNMLAGRHPVDINPQLLKPAQREVP